MNQTFSDWECILVDDGSEQVTLDVIESYTKKDSRFKYLDRPKNKNGASVCRNVGLRAAAGHFIMFVDSDDVLAPWTLQHRLNFYTNQTKPLDFVVFGQLMFHQKVGDSVQLWAKKENYKDSLITFLNLHSPWAISSVLWHMEFLATNNLIFDESALNWQDCEFHIRALLLTDRFEWSEESLRLPDGYIRLHQLNRISNVEKDELNYALNRIQTQTKIAGLVPESFKPMLSKAQYKYIINRLNKFILYTQHHPLTFQECLSLIDRTALSGIDKIIVRCYLLFLYFTKWSGIRSLYKLLRNNMKKRIEPHKGNTDLLKIDQKSLSIVLQKLRDSAFQKHLIK